MWAADTIVLAGMHILCIALRSRLTVVSRAAKQSRTSDTTVCYIHERSILIERSLKACYKKIPYEKQRALQEQLPITSNIRLLTI